MIDAAHKIKLLDSDKVLAIFDEFCWVSFQIENGMLIIISLFEKLFPVCIVTEDACLYDMEFLETWRQNWDFRANNLLDSRR